MFWRLNGRAVRAPLILSIDPASLSRPSPIRYHHVQTWLIHSNDCNGKPTQRWLLFPGETAVRLQGTDFCLDAGLSMFPLAGLS